MKPHGIRGEVVVEPSTESPDRFARGETLWVGDPVGTPKKLRIAASRAHHGGYILGLDGVRDRTAAETLRGALLSIPVHEARPLQEGRYYPHQIEGFDVVDEEETTLGTLAGVLENPANDLWVVRSGEREVLVPAVKDIVRSVDLTARRIVLRPVPGLFDEDEQA